MKGYLFVDYATQGYVALVGLFILIFHGGTVPDWRGLVALHVLGLAVIHGLIRWAASRPRNPVLEFLRHFYPVLLYTAFFCETGMLNQMFVPNYLDPWFLGLEQRLFGMQPSVEFMNRLPYLLVSEVFFASYFSYYLMIGGVGLALFLRQRRAFYHYVSVVSFVFYVCYVAYIFLPVMGPRGFFREIGGYRIPMEAAGLSAVPEYPAAVQGGPFYWIMTQIYSGLEAAGAAFPSSHVAVSICTCMFSWRYLRPIRWIHSVMVTLLCLATVYCRYHYLVDVIAGVATGLILVPLGDWLHSRMASRAVNS